MKFHNQEHFEFEALPKKAREELLDFYEFLLDKYGKMERKKSMAERKKLCFFESVKKHSFTLPHDYKFDREALHER